MDFSLSPQRHAIVDARRTQIPIVGPALLIVCLLHCALAVVSGAAVWQEALNDGWFGAFTGAERQMVLWFFVTGLVGAIAGVAISVVKRRQRLPWLVSVPLAMVAVFGVLAVPTSGFWLVLVVALLALYRSLPRVKSTTNRPGNGPRDETL